MQAVRYTRHARGGRVYILGLRLHHGTVGVAAILVGALLCAHDWADHRFWWFRDGD